MITVPLRDGTFHGPSMSLSSENANEAPELLRWQRVEQLPDAPVTVFTDMCLDEVLLSKSPTNVAILIEPPAFSATHYRKAVELQDHFDAIFTYEREYVERGPPFLLYLVGGSRIREWGVFPKGKMVSIIVSDKWVTEGHLLRHRIVEELLPQFPGLEVFGEPYGPYLDPKGPGLRPFRYSVVVESGRSDYYFTEKLVDCLSQGTVPIYWGCPSVQRFFDSDGIITFETLDDLAYILASISEQDYLRRLPAVRWNLDLACGFRCAEDWMYLNHTELFET